MYIWLFLNYSKQILFMDLCSFYNDVIMMLMIKEQINYFQIKKKKKKLRVKYYLGWHNSH